MKGSVAALVGLLLIAGCASRPAQQTPELRISSADIDEVLGGGQLAGAKLAAAIRKAGAAPLGSKANPVRVDLPPGEYAYLGRLRCLNGSRPAATRQGSVGAGPFGSVLDLYSLSCPGRGATDLYMDMYHPEHEERSAPPGFTLAPH